MLKVKIGKQNVDGQDDKCRSFLRDNWDGVNVFIKVNKWIEIQLLKKPAAEKELIQ